MSMVGLVEVIFMFFLTWIPDSPSGTPATPQQYLAHVPKDAVFVITLDVGSMAKPLLNGFRGLQNETFIQKIPELKMGYEQVLNTINGGLKEIERQAGVDIEKDIRYVTMALKVEKRQEYFLLVVGGSLPADTTARLKRLISPQPEVTTSQNKPKAAKKDAPPDDVDFFMPSDSVVVVGSPEWIKQSKATKGKGFAQKNSIAERMVPLITSNTYASLGISITPYLQDEMRHDLEGPLVPLIGTMQAAWFGLHFKGATMKLWTSDKVVLERYGKLLRGLGKWVESSAALSSGTLELLDGLFYLGDPDLPHGAQQLLAEKKSLLAYLSKKIVAPKTTVEVKLLDNEKAAVMEITGKALFLPAVGLAIPLMILGM